MKVCVTSNGDNLEATVDPRFGRCGYFIIVDPGTLEFNLHSLWPKKGQKPW